MFVDPMRSHLKQEPDRSRTPTNKELHRLYMESPHSKQPPPSSSSRMPQESERNSKYKEENRLILKESIEVAPYTAKIRSGESEREHYSRITSQSKSHEKEMEHSDLYKYRHSVSQSLPQTNYFTTLSNSVMNEPPRLYSSNNSYFDKVPPASSPLSLSTYSTTHSKSLSKPPPLIKHQPETEGLMGKITEQLSQQPPVHSLGTSVVTVTERCSPAISPSAQPKGMPALRRAPVFHPPTQQTPDRKEVAYGRLSPPTLTPIQPVSSAGKVSEQQKPPTLLPELRDEKSGAEPEPWKSHDKMTRQSENSQIKPQVAMASVIVRPSTCIKYDGSPGPKMTSKEPPGGRMFAGRPQSVAESRESGRVILPNTNLQDSSEQYKKNLMRVTQSSVSSSAVPVLNSVSDESTAASGFSLENHSRGEELSFPVSGTSSSIRPESSASKSQTPTISESQEGGSRTTSPTAGCAQAYSRNFVHLKKAKAALAAAQSRGSSSASESESGSVRSSQDSPTIIQDNTSQGNPASKASPLPNGQPAQVCQQNYHKLKKAWLTRHSEEDKNTNKSEKGTNAISELIKPCTVSLIAGSASTDVDLSKDGKGQEDKLSPEDRKTRHVLKRSYESASDSGDDSDSSESKLEQRTKRQPKPTYKKKQNDMQKRKGDNEKDDDEMKTNCIFRSAKEKTKLKLASTSKSQ